jgi:hypothetical protein
MKIDRCTDLIDVSIVNVYNFHALYVLLYVTAVKFVSYHFVCAFKIDT